MLFYTILTDIGKAKIANATATGIPVSITEIAVGDGGGVQVIPDATALSLTGEVWRSVLNSIAVDPSNVNNIIAEGYIPTTEGGFTIREVGLFDDVGDMIAIGSYPDTFKPTLESGSAKDLYMKVSIEVSSVSTINLVIDPSLVTASRELVDTKVNQHDADLNSHGNALVPAGMPMAFAGTTAPQGFLIMDGSEVAQLDFPELYAAIGDAWATTGGASAPLAGNFRLPPQEIGGLGLYMRGVGTTNGAVGTYQADVFKSHNHTYTRYGIFYTGQAVASGAANTWQNANTGVGTSTNGDATETRPRSITMLMCIKY